VGRDWADVEDVMALTHTDVIEVKRIKGKGRGVFARRLIKRGEVIERVPVLVLKSGDVEELTAWEGLASYCFVWGEGTVALALGYGSLYNHSFRPNAKYEDIGQQTKVYSAIREIRPGEEVTINYNGDPASRTPVGFQVIESKRVRASKPQT
jgi:SET domain-containing protein